MKTLFFSISRIAYGLITCFTAIIFTTSNAQTVDIAEFLLIEPGHTWDMSGTASWSGIGLPVTATVVTEAGDTFHGTETTELTLTAGGSAFFQTVEVNETINVSLSATHLMLHSRVGEVWLNNKLEEEDTEIYNVPAEILPRLITVGESYAYTADLDSGSFEDSVVFESIEWIDTGLGSVETIKLVVFSEGDTPVTLWLGRGLGYMQAEITTTLDDKPINVTGNLTGLDILFIGESVQAFWGETIAYADGWRFSDWMGYFWVPYVDSRWINHNGFGWTYCFGNLQDMWLYVQGIGWFWSNELYYPWMFSPTHGRFLQNSPASSWFYDPGTGEWIDLAP